MIVVILFLCALAVATYVIRHRPVTELDRRLAAVDAELSGEVRPAVTLAIAA